VEDRPFCPRCGSVRVVKSGPARGKQRWLCRRCRYVNGLYKTEVIRRRVPWRTLEAVEFATLEWVDWFNNRHLLEPIGNIPLAEAEARYYASS
jgi:transposase InsO family protein